jgi:hypothetical protein
MKATSLIPDMMADPKWSQMEGTHNSVFTRAFDSVFWEFLAAPGNEARQARFGAAMAAYERQFPPHLILQGAPCLLLWTRNLTPV